MISRQKSKSVVDRVARFMPLQNTCSVLFPDICAPPLLSESVASCHVEERSYSELADIHRLNIDDLEVHPIPPKANLAFAFAVFYFNAVSFSAFLLAKRKTDLNRES